MTLVVVCSLFRGLEVTKEKRVHRVETDRRSGRIKALPVSPGVRVNIVHELHTVVCFPQGQTGAPGFPGDVGDRGYMVRKCCVQKSDQNIFWEKALCGYK